MALFALNALVGYPLLIRLRPRLLQAAEAFTRRFIVTDPYHLQPPAYYEEKIQSLYRLMLEATLWSNPLLLTPFAVLVIAWGFWRFLGQGPGIYRWTQACWGVLIVLDLFVLAGGVRHNMPLSRVTDPPSSVHLIQEQMSSPLCRLYWAADDQAVTNLSQHLALLPANYSLIFGLSNTGLYSPLGFHDYYRLLGGLGGVNLAFGLPPTSPRAVSQQKPLLDFLNACFILSRQPLTGMEPLGHVDGVFIYKNQGVLPRIFVVDRLEVIPSADAALKKMQAGPESLRHTAILAAPLPEPLSPGAAQSARVTLRSYAPTRVEIEASTSGTVLLVMSDTAYPGWLAQLDGSPVALHRANVLFRAVVIPPGNHLVTFTYEPRTFWQGIKVAAVSAFALAGWSLASSGLIPTRMRKQG